MICKCNNYTVCRGLGLLRKMHLKNGLAYSAEFFLIDYILDNFVFLIQIASVKSSYTIVSNITEPLVEIFPVRHVWLLSLTLVVSYI